MKTKKSAKKPSLPTIIASLCLIATISISTVSYYLNRNNIPLASAISISSISPSSGPIPGGTKVTITGDNFTEPKGIIQSATGSMHSLAVDSTGTVYSWGNNDYGQLGNGSTWTNVLEPTIITSISSLPSKVISVAAGANTSYAITEDGDVYAWGDNYDGQIGNGDWADVLIPEKINGAGGDITASTKIKAISAGIYHTLAIDYDGNLYSWGFGYLGHNISVGLYDLPVKVNGANGEDANKITSSTKIIAIESGSMHSLALDDQGNIYAWGSNTSGEIGNGVAGADVVTPSKLNGLHGEDSNMIATTTKISAISASVSHSVATDTLGNVYTWGNNSYGKLGNGTTGGATINKPTKITIPAEITQISAGGSYTIALDKDGKVYSWGWAGSGHLGNGSTTGESNTPILINGINGESATTINSNTVVTNIFTNEAHTGAIDSDGNLYMWGLNINGQLGNQTTTNNPVPTTTIQAILATTVKIGSNSCTNVTIVNSSTITCVVPAHTSPATVNVTMFNGINSVVLNNGYTYYNLGAPNTGAGNN
jgi:Alpha-tubulin suppressor and related RCC1 domain-containing proteins